MVRSESPETLYTMTTQQTKPPGALVIDTRWRTHTHAHTQRIVFHKSGQCKSKLQLSLLIAFFADARNWHNDVYNMSLI